MNESSRPGESYAPGVREVAVRQHLQAIAGGVSGSCRLERHSCV